MQISTDDAVCKGKELSRMFLTILFYNQGLGNEPRCGAGSIVCFEHLFETSVSATFFGGFSVPQNLQLYIWVQEDESICRPGSLIQKQPETGLKGECIIVQHIYGLLDNCQKPISGLPLIHHQNGKTFHRQFCPKIARTGFRQECIKCSTFIDSAIRGIVNCSVFDLSI